MKQIIAICGYKRAGKDTVSNILCSEYGYQNMKISHHLKKLCKDLFGFTDDQVEGESKDVVDPIWGITPRQGMQFFGTDVMQYCIKDLLPDIERKFWIKKMIKDINDTSYDKIVISDLRFIHEYDELKKIYGNNVSIWRVERPDLQYNETNQHVSEVEWQYIPYNVKIVNDSCIETLKRKVVLTKGNNSST